MKSLEGYEKDEIKKYLKNIGAWFCMIPANGYGASGQPDIVACIEGTFWSIEVKREGKTPTVLQTRRLEEVIKAGGHACWGTAEKVIGEITLWSTQRDCPVCGGDCAAANPPVINCPRK